jgi:uncharacterized protein
VTPGVPALCSGTVFHRREQPTVHEFAYPVRSVWCDPDDPAAVAAAHPLWSAHRLAPARFRAGDYGDGSTRPLGEQARDDLAGALGHRPTGPVRMLTQWRRWGWLFNPITVFVAWDRPDGDPVGAVLEVTNTPWKERHRYPTALTPAAGGGFTASIDKVLHVSPFLDEGCRYHMTLRADDERTLAFGIDVVDRSNGAVVLVTGMRLEREPITRAALAAALWHDGFPTHRVSAGIHAQAARLWRKRVPFVAHPRTRSGVEPVEPVGSARVG